MHRTIPGLVFILLLVALSPVFSAVAQEDAERNSEEPAPAGVNEQGTEPGPGFPFLGVGPEARIDPTRKADYEDFYLDIEHYCTGCWCNNIFGEHLDESWNELVGKSETVQELWRAISRCIDPLRNAIPQVRTIPLESKYDDIAFDEVIFYFSEFLDAPLAARIQVNRPEEYLGTLQMLFGEPENIEDTWYLWERPGAVMLYDLFNVLRHKRPRGELLVVYNDTLREHLRRVREVEREGQ